MLFRSFYLPFDWRYYGAAIVFFIAGATDWLDGYLARLWNQATPFGAFLDPVADKLMVAIALMLLVDEHHTMWLTIPASIIVGREIVISALREWMAEMGKRASIAVSYVGKIKTACQMFAIFVLLGSVPESPFAYAGLAILYVAASLTLWSMAMYIRTAWPDLNPFQSNK